MKTTVPRKGLRALLDEVYTPMPSIRCRECNDEIMGRTKTDAAQSAWEEGWGIIDGSVYCVNCRGEREDERAL